MVAALSVIAPGGRLYLSQNNKGTTNMGIEPGTTGSAKESWGSGDAYERFVGRWSRRLALEFLGWLNAGPGLRWGDVGCGTGALTQRILAGFQPASILAVDRTEGFIQAARARVNDPRVRFELGDALTLTWPDNSCDAVVSGLVLNFVPDPRRMAAEMARVTRPGGTVGAYVWDYSGGMQMLRHFWDAAVEINPNDSKLDQAERFPICQPQPLESLFREIGLDSVAVRAIDIPTVFRDFDDYWDPFLGRQGSAPTYLAGLDAAVVERIRDTLKARLTPADDGSIALTARAWAVQGIVP
jgi:SAM-dependent methyltransferase